MMRPTEMVGPTMMNVRASMACKRPFTRREQASEQANCISVTLVNPTPNLINQTNRGSWQAYHNSTDCRRF